jgi:hypothetical protein
MGIHAEGSIVSNGRMGLGATVNLSKALDDHGPKITLPFIGYFDITELSLPPDSS